MFKLLPKTHGTPVCLEKIHRSQYTVMVAHPVSSLHMTDKLTDMSGTLDSKLR